MAIKQAIVTYDSERVRSWNLQGEGSSIAWIFMNALTGKPHPNERGVISIRHIPDDSEIIVAPRMDRAAPT
jgi:hypothetical protein